MVRCQYDIDFVQEYLDGTLSIESRAEYEMHLSKCRDCRQFTKAYDLLTQYISTDVSFNQEIPTETILLKLDTRIYDKKNIGSKIRALIFKLLPAGRILAFASAAIIIFALSLVSIVFFDTKFSQMLYSGNDTMGSPKSEEQVTLTADEAMAGEEAIQFVDAEFEKRIREMLEKQEGEPIYPEELSGIESLNIRADTLRQYNGVYFDGMYQYVDENGVEHTKHGSISTLDDLIWFSNLASVTITANEITDIGALAWLPDIQFLDLSHNKIENIACLSKLSNLVYLGLNNNEITDLEPLDQLSELRYLEAAFNRITDLSPLKGLLNLEELTFYDNQIYDISPLKELNKLRCLGIENNRIEDISVLSDKINLTSLFLSNNRIADLKPILRLKKLKNLTVFGNPAADQISPDDFVSLEMFDLKLIDTED